MRSLLLLVLAVVSFCAVSGAVHYNFEVELGNNFSDQSGSIRQFKLEKGMFSSKTQILDNSGHGNHLPQHEKLVPGKLVRGLVTIADGIDKWKTVSLIWDSDQGSNGSIEVKRLTFTPDVSTAGPRHLSKWTKVFCFDGSIESGQEATFHDCTKQQNNYYLQP